MAKKREKGEAKVDIFQQLADQTNGELLGQMKAAKYFIDTGNLAFNFIASGKFVDGGLPGGRISEFYGPSSSGKSLWATNLLFGCQKLGGYAILLDCENASNPEWIRKASHLDVDRVLRYTPKTLEDCFHKMYTIIKLIRHHDADTPIMIVYDSITVSPTARQLRELDLPENYTEADFKRIVQRHEQPGERAKVISSELMKLNGLMEEMDATILIVNQVRMAIGVSYGSPETTSGGKALEFYCSQRFRTSAHKQIKNPRLGDMVTGVNVKIANKKNRFFRPHAYAENVQLLFDRGINPLSGLLEVLIQAERIEAKSGGNYSVLPDYIPQGRESYTFKSSKARGDVPRDLVFDCPNIIDAASRDEVEAYLAPYANFESLEAEGSISEESFADMIAEDDS